MVLAAVVLLIAVQMPGEDEPPVPTARVDDVRRLGDQFHVVVDVTNTGDQTAANVQIHGELNVRGEVRTGEKTVAFRTGGEHVQDWKSVVTATWVYITLVLSVLRLIKNKKNYN